MTQVLTARVPDETAERVRQCARRKRRSVNEMMGIALEEWLRQNEFSGIEFRDTLDGRQAYMKGTRIPVAWLVQQWREMDCDERRLESLWPGRPTGWAQAALNYYQAYPQEIEDELAANASDSQFESLRRRFPSLERVEAPAGE